MTMKLITKPGCPFAERTRIVLAWLSLEPEIVEVDLERKPDWFTALSPLGKVPVLIHEDTALFESTAIDEYLVERSGAESGLVPADPLVRAQMRAWIQFDETALVPAFYRLLLAEPSAWEARRATYLERLTVLETHLSRGGPIFSETRRRWRT